MCCERFLPVAVSIKQMMYSGARTVTYAIVQSLYNDSALWGGYYNAADDVITMESGIGITTYLSIMEDETIYAEAFGVGYDINVSSIELPLDDLQEIIGNLEFWG